MSTKNIHDDRSRMDRDIQLIEPDPYNDGEMRWRSEWELEEWAYEQGYDCGVDELWKSAPSEVSAKIGDMYLQEGPEAAEVVLEEEINHAVNVVTDEWLETYVDGQFRLFAGYDVAENGDTLEEGDQDTWENLRLKWEAGFRDRLRANEKYESIQ